MTLITPTWTVKLVARWNDLMQRITGKVRLPNTDKLGELLPLSWCCSGAKAREHFGFNCEVPLAEGLAETAAWYEQKGWIKVKR